MGIRFSICSQDGRKRLVKSILFFDEPASTPPKDARLRQPRFSRADPARQTLGARGGSNAHVSRQSRDVE
jgi:hypothetical protein